MPLPIHVKAVELFNQTTGTFYYTEPQTLILEHSLVSISKWESKWHKMYLETPNKTADELLDYVRCMTINKNVPDYVYYALSQENIDEIVQYMNDPMTASSVYEPNSGGHHELVSSELIYYWMIAFHIPLECEKWHLNRLLTLIKICEVKNAPPKKMRRKDIYSRNAALNAARKQKIAASGGLP